MRLGITVGVLGLALLYPICACFGLDSSLGWMSNGYMPSEGELLGSALVLGARVTQWVVAPILGLTWAAWLATARLRA